MLGMDLTGSNGPMVQGKEKDFLMGGTQLIWSNGPRKKKDIFSNLNISIRHSAESMVQKNRTGFLSSLLLGFWQRS